MSDREFVNAAADDPNPWIVMCRSDHISSKMELIEAWPTREHALHCGRVRHEQGYVVSVYQEIAYTIGV